LEIILRRLAEFQERAQALRRKVKGAMVYPITVVMFAFGILTFIMISIVPQFGKMFKELDVDMPYMTQLLIDISNNAVDYWYVIPAFPTAIWLFIKLMRKFEAGRLGWDLFTLKIPIFGQLAEKNIVARTTRTLGTLVASGVPILEALHITKETAGNAVFELLYQKVYESIREGESISKPLQENSVPPIHPIAILFWFLFVGGPIGVLIYVTRMRDRVIDDMVVNMVDVGEETGELDTMLYKVADTYDDEVAVITDSLMSLMEPLLIIVLGGMVGFIVIALFMPLISMITTLSSPGGGKKKLKKH
jgi:type IV pilus assembly protein PilC